MLARKQKNASTVSALLAARLTLKERGWSYRSAAPALQVHYTHLCLVLCGHRESRALLRRIRSIPFRKPA